MIQWGFTHHLSHQLYQWEIITVPGSVSFHKFAMFIFWSVLSDWIQSFFWFLCYCNNAIVLLSGIIVYLLKKYIFYCFWNNLFDNLTSSCIVIVYRSEQQVKFWWLVEFLIWKKEGTKPAQLVFRKCVITQETLKFFFLEIEWITEIYDKQTW